MSFLIAGGALTVASSLFGMGSAKKARRAAAAEKRKQEAKLASLEKNRQAVINPFSGTKDLSSMAQDLSGNLSNPYASLGVSTQAAEMQIEEADIALANTLDTLRATGSGAGGATALAQAALQSKKGVSASIETQEAANEKLKADGQQQLEQLKMAEQTRIQGIQIGEGQRVQQADAAGKSFMFNTTENREISKMNRVAGLADRAANQEAQARADGNAALTGMISGLGSLASAGISSAASTKAANISKFGNKTENYVK
jgi:hypothetical protein